MIYFDYNATTKILPEAKEAWIKAVDEYIGNPSSPHRLGSRAETALNNAREELAAMLGCHPLDIVWTSGATEAANTLFHHFYLKLTDNCNVWISPIEHPSVLEPARFYFKSRIRFIPVDKEGVVSVKWIRTNLGVEKPGLVVVMAANNETGVIQPFKEIATLCREYNVPFFCDAAQWIGKLPVKELAICDFLSASAHKFGGPRGVGFLKCGHNITPLILGGPQEEGRRAGTENVAGVISMIAALKVCEQLLARMLKPVNSDDSTKSFVNQPEEKIAIRNEFEKGLLDAIPGLLIAGRNAQRLWNTTHLIMPQTACNVRWVVKLDKLGFAVSTGSACSSGKEKPSHVLKAMNYGDEQASRAIRCSSGFSTTKDEWMALKNAIVKVYTEVAATS